MSTGDETETQKLAWPGQESRRTNDTATAEKGQMLRCDQHTVNTAWGNLISQWSPHHSLPFIKDWRHILETTYFNGWCSLNACMAASRPAGKGALSSLSSSSAWMHLTAPPRKGKRGGGRLISFLKAPVTVDNTQAPLPAHLQGQPAEHSLQEDLHYSKVFTPLWE